MKNYAQLVAMLTLIMNAHAFRASNNFKELLVLDANGRNSVTQEEEKKVLRTKISPAPKSSKALIDSKTEYLEGVCDWEQNRINSEEMFIITKLLVGYDSNAAADKEGSLTYKKAAPGSIRNAFITINQDNKELFKSPLALLLNPHTGNNVDDDVIELDIPIVLVDSARFDFTITYPEGAAAATGAGNENEYLEIVAQGYNIVRSSTKK